MNLKTILFSFLLVSISTTFLAFQQKFDLKASIARGQVVYSAQCITCHMEKGEGVEGAFPPLAKSDDLMADKNRSIKQIRSGVSGEIKVNGVLYNGEMTGIELTDEELSDVLNYVRNNWGNKGEAIKPADVKAVK